ncbi:MAG: hypothetical protein ACKVWR_06060 [Acidimicrobiales bacterium]
MVAARSRVWWGAPIALIWLAAACLLASPGGAQQTPAGWRFADRPVRVRVLANAGAVGRVDHVVDAAINFTQILEGVGRAGAAPSIPSLRLVEVDTAGAVVDDAVAFQWEGGANGRLVWMLEGPTPAGVVRTYDLYADVAGSGVAHQPADVAPRVSVSELTHEGAATYRIATPNGVWLFDRPGGGFSSLLDPEGRDWISFRNSPGSQGGGEFRGIPNMVNPEGCFHPGLTNAQSAISASGPLRVSITTSAVCGTSWTMRWDISVAGAKATILAAPSRPYWFLYEGTPGGALDSGDSVIRSTGQVTGIDDSWGLQGGVDLDWAAFADAGAGRALYLTDDNGDEQPDSYWNLNGEMTVFGFGRSQLTSPEDNHLTGANRSFHVGLVAAGDPAPAIRSAFLPTPVAVGSASALGAPPPAAPPAAPPASSPAARAASPSNLRSSTATGGASVAGRTLANTGPRSSGAPAAALGLAFLVSGGIVLRFRLRPAAGR